MDLPYAPLPVEEEDGLRWVYRPAAGRNRPSEADGMTLENGESRRMSG